MLGTLPWPTATALPPGQVAVTCQVTRGRATFKYFITIFYYDTFEALYAVTSHVPHFPVWWQTHPWLCCGVLSLVYDLSEVYATLCVRLLCSPLSSPRNFFNSQPRAALKKGRRLKSHLAPGLFTKTRNKTPVK